MDITRQAKGNVGHDNVVPAAALTATIGLAAAGWIVTVQRMHGMDMGVATRLGSLPYFLSVWVPMMAAMMLPGTAPAVQKNVRAGGGYWTFRATSGGTSPFGPASASLCTRRTARMGPWRPA